MEGIQTQKAPPIPAFANLTPGAHPRRAFLSEAVSPMHEVRFLPTIICFCIGAVAPLAMVGWILLR